MQVLFCCYKHILLLVMTGKKPAGHNEKKKEELLHVMLLLSDLAIIRHAFSIRYNMKFLLLGE